MTRAEKKRLEALSDNQSLTPITYEELCKASRELKVLVRQQQLSSFGIRGTPQRRHLRTPQRGGTYKYLREDLRRGYLWILGEDLSAAGLRSAEVPTSILERTSGGGTYGYLERASPQQDYAVRRYLRVSLRGPPEGVPIDT
jgi:hypothetical protein